MAALLPASRLSGREEVMLSHPAQQNMAAVGLWARCCIRAGTAGMCVCSLTAHDRSGVGPINCRRSSQAPTGSWHSCCACKVGSQQQSCIILVGQAQLHGLAGCRGAETGSMSAAGRQEAVTPCIDGHMQQPSSAARARTHASPVRRRASPSSTVTAALLLPSGTTAGVTSEAPSNRPAAATKLPVPTDSDLPTGCRAMG